MDTLFDLHHDLAGIRVANWEPSPPPELRGAKEIILDYETTGLRWWKDARPGGVAYYLPDGRTGYLPWAHKAGKNLDEAVVKRWHKEQLKGVNITNINTRFEVHQAYAWGVDLEAQGCTFSDVAHYAALLDDSRRKFNLALLCQDFLSDEEKVLAVEGHTLDATRMMDYDSSVVAVRGMADVRQVHKLKEAMWPRLDAEDLQRVRQLEDDLIPVVCEMERNACLINVELLHKWLKETEQEYLRCLWRVARAVGFQVSPNKSKDIKKLFDHLKIPVTSWTDSGGPSFTDAVLKSIDHPVVKDLYRAAKLDDLRSKYIVKYSKTIGDDRLLRYALHQLRSDEGGTISGRFSSSAIDGEGCNIQQIMTAEKQMKIYGPDYIVQELFIPEKGSMLLSADAKQIEYRIFADRASTPKVLKAYQDNPNLSFHELIWEMIKKFKPDITYKQQKNMNFMRIYGGGMAKLAYMLDYITEHELVSLQKAHPKGVPHKHPKLAQAVVVSRIYDRELPEVKPLLDKYIKMAETQGYITTMLGRRMRFEQKFRLHKAFNGHVQGTAADIMKQKLVELHKNRKETGLKLRATIHDAVIGDVHEWENAKKVAKLLNAQTFKPKLKIDILWEVSTGSNWAIANPKSGRAVQYDPTKIDASRPGNSPEIP